MVGFVFLNSLVAGGDKENEKNEIKEVFGHDNEG
jgi:hypothetical protein